MKPRAAARARLGIWRTAAASPAGRRPEPERFAMKAKPFRRKHPAASSLPGQASVGTRGIQWMPRSTTAASPASAAANRQYRKRIKHVRSMKRTNRCTRLLMAVALTTLVAAINSERRSARPNGRSSCVPSRPGTSRITNWPRPPRTRAASTPSASVRRSIWRPK